MAKKIFDTPDTTAQFAPEDIELNNRLSLLAYLGILPWLVPMFLVKQSRFAKFHANQGLVLIILNVILGIITGALNGIASLIGSGITALFFKMASSWGAMFLGTVGTVISTIITIIAAILSILLSIVVLFLTVVGIIYAVKGRAKELPLIGRFKILKY